MPKKQKELVTVKQYEEMGYSRLHRLLLQSVSQEQRVIRWFNKAAQFDLLPALTAMQHLTASPGRRADLMVEDKIPDWQSECKTLGLTAAVVRLWKHRTAAETDIRHLIGDEEPHPRAKKEEADAAKLAVAMKQLRRLVKLVEEGKFEQLDEDAVAIQEYYGF